MPDPLVSSSQVLGLQAFINIVGHTCVGFLQCVLKTIWSRIFCTLLEMHFLSSVDGGRSDSFCWRASSHMDFCSHMDCYLSSSV